MVDVSDATQSAHGSLDSITVTNFFASIPAPVNVTSASATALAVGRLGATTPAFTVDASTGSQVAGLKVVGAVTTGTVAVVVTDSGAVNTNLTINALGSGTIGIGSVSTGRVTITPVTTITGSLTLSAALIYGGVTLSNAVTGTAKMVLSNAPTFDAGAVFAGALSGITTLGMSGVLTAASASAHTLGSVTVTATQVSTTAGNDLSLAAASGQKIQVLNIVKLQGWTAQSWQFDATPTVSVLNNGQVDLGAFVSGWGYFYNVTDDNFVGFVVKDGSAMQFVDGGAAWNALGTGSANNLGISGGHLILENKKGHTALYSGYIVKMG